MYKVLIIDDDKLARKGLIAIVPWKDFSLEVIGDVSNGVNGLEFLEHQLADLVIVDMSMPVLSGLDFMRECKKRWPQVQFVGLSFHESFDYVQGSMRLGALDYISKLQMEQEDCTEIFKRISIRLDEKLRKDEREPQDNDWQALDIELVEALKTEWCLLYWVYDNEYFEQLVDRTTKQIVTVRQMELLLVWIVQSLETAFAFGDNHIPAINAACEGLRWLIARREQVLSGIKAQSVCASIPQCILKATQIIYEKLSEPIHAEEIALAVNMSRGYFSTNFKAVTGMTFNDFLKKERIYLAKTLIHNQNLSIDELAAAVGYEDAKYFSRVFCELTGVSCTAFREQMSPNKAQK